MPRSSVMGNFSPQLAAMPYLMPRAAAQGDGLVDRQPALEMDVKIDQRIAGLLESRDLGVDRVGRGSCGGLIGSCRYAEGKNARDWPRDKTEYARLRNISFHGSLARESVNWGRARNCVAECPIIAVRQAKGNRPPRHRARLCSRLTSPLPC